MAGSIAAEDFEARRARELRSAQDKARVLFDEIASRKLIRPGVKEGQINEEVYRLANEMFGVTTFWHKRIVRAGANTLAPYADNPPDRLLGEDEIAFVDLGPVFEQWEADFGRTFVIGSDPVKLKVRDDVERAFAAGKQYFKQNEAITANELFHYVVGLAEESGWEFGGPIAGHLIGQFPHERIAGDKVTLYIHPASHVPIRSLDSEGRKRHWILEIHFVDRDREIGGFFEELLTVD